ncbi:CoA pyrophosphatase [Hyphococcus flavus]|uniref:CoA pyrophosphatase n=1 Tax=Hyphococcus flavus TaxID=1866326 RepID=A0AAF0CDZ3_9PROT|nr:CoA pyrophosphatase [Hyphococcus flavus]WDI30446.1 CoA pyrophosphatase [Hyphococcus flavus]
MKSKLNAAGDNLRSLIEANLKHASAQRVHDLFREINPHLVGDKLFEKRWSDKRKDAAVLVPIVYREEGARVILTVRSTDMPSHAGQISFPGGKTQSEDRGPIDTALREAEEEVNIAPAFVDVIGTMGVHKGGLGFSVTPVVGLVDPQADLKPCPREVDEIFEVPVEFLGDLANHIIEERSLNGIPYKMFAAIYGPYHIWGLTAGILRSFAEMLQHSDFLQEARR